MRDIVNKLKRCSKLFKKQNLVHYRGSLSSINYFDEGHFSFDVEIDQIVGNFGFNFSKDNHPFVRTTIEDIINKKTTWDTSYLKQYYSTFCPKNLAEVYSYNSSDNFDNLINYSQFLRFEPWRLSEKFISGYEGEGNQNFGPVTKIKGHYEFNKLKKLHQSIITYGYIPSHNITGYFMKFNNQYRFRITDGVHRTAVLSALGYKKIKVQFDPIMPRIICFNDSHNWPKIKEGKIDLQTAQKIFMVYFNNNREMK